MQNPQIATPLDNAVNQVGQVVDAASVAAENIAAAAQLAGSPEAMANAIVWAQKRITELEGIIADLQSPEAKAAEASVEGVVTTIPVAWIEKVEALMTHAEAALGFRHTPQ
jgi:hypothetical protein